MAHYNDVIRRIVASLPAPIISASLQQRFPTL